MPTYREGIAIVKKLRATNQTMNKQKHDDTFDTAKNYLSLIHDAIHAREFFTGNNADDFAQNITNIYPNPFLAGSGNTLKIELSITCTTSIILDILSMQGKLILPVARNKKYEISENQTVTDPIEPFEINSLPAGLYVARMEFTDCDTNARKTVSRNFSVISEYLKTLEK
jgi:hypothetical protein